MNEIDTIILLNKINDNFTFHDRLTKLAEECSELLKEYFHYSSRGEEYFESLLEEIAGIDFVMLSMKRKIMSIPEFRNQYKIIFAQQIAKAVLSIDTDIEKREDRIKC